MNYTFCKIENILFKGYDTYYKSPIETSMHKATVMNDKYVYYLKTSLDDTRLLGKYLRMTKISVSLPHFDMDYDAYQFEQDKIICNSPNIYCCGIPDIDENMIRIEDATYQNCEMYYKKILIC